MTLTNPGLESLKAGGPLSEDLFAGDAPISSVTGMVLYLACLAACGVFCQLATPFTAAWLFLHLSLRMPSFF